MVETFAKSAGRASGRHLGTEEFLANVEQLTALGMAPSESTKCCATGTC